MNNFEIDITYRCNLACKWCDRLCGTEFRRPIDMTATQLERYVSIIAPHINRRSSIRILGGEPMLHPQIFKMLDILIQAIRPLIEFPITIVTNGYGEKVNNVLTQIRECYDTCDNSHLSTNTTLRPSSSKQFCIVASKTLRPEAYVEQYHTSVTRAAIDFMSRSEITKYAETCWVRRTCGYGITAHGIFICAGAAPSICGLFKLNPGLDHFPTTKEEDEQAERICEYCRIPCDPNQDLSGPPKIRPAILLSKSYENAIREWRRESYHLPVVL